MMMDREKRIAMFVAAWFLCGLFLGWWMGKVYPNPPFHSYTLYPEFLIIVTVLVVALAFLTKFRRAFDKFIAGAVLIFHSFPTLALMFEPDLYFMYLPTGIFILLSAPWNPLYFFPPTQLYLAWLPMGQLLPLNLGSCIFFIGTGIFMMALFQLLLGKGLVTSGLYSVVRHPQYLGLILTTLGLTLGGQGSRLISIMSWAALVAAYIFLAEREEKGLQRRYGEEFISYKRRVPFLLPLLPPGMLKLSKPSSRMKKYLCIWGITTILVYIGVIIIPITYVWIVLRPAPSDIAPFVFMSLITMVVAGVSSILVLASGRYRKLRHLIFLCLSLGFLSPLLFPSRSLTYLFLFSPYFITIIFVAWLSQEKPTIRKT